MKFYPSLTFLLSCLLLTINTSRAGVEIYDYPSEAPRAADFEVTVNGAPVFVYNTAIAAVAAFGIDGKAEIRVKPKKPFQNVIIRPLADNVRSTTDHGEIAFTIDAPIQLSLELDNDIGRPLFIFGNRPEKRPANLADSNLIYFAPGKVHRAEEILLTTGKTLYLAGGAIVEGYIRAEGAENIKIEGPGILCGTYRTESKVRMVSITACKNVEIRDLLMIDTLGWTMHLNHSQNILVEHVKQVCWRANSDGIDVDASSQVRISDCFLRNNDDCIAVKCSRREGLKTASGLLVERCVLWNGVPGNALEIGFELRAERVSDLVFRDCDIIRIERGAAFSIHNADSAVVENVTFENIRLEDVRGEFADIHVGLSRYSEDSPEIYFRGNPKRIPIPNELRDPSIGTTSEHWIMPPDRSVHAAKRGSIKNIKFENISVYGEQLPPSFFIGYDADHQIDNVTFHKIRVGGKTINEWPPVNAKIREATAIRFVD
ncbi:MAG: right-handed parallel beta-helix repeat-containing protein [Gloeobacteraceae cyanobacterium ES-bin-144]|nr:right-handed parallel beta-helix repeat-containing protein [Verrucomicrobiales bacterium]